MSSNETEFLASNYTKCKRQKFDKLITETAQVKSNRNSGLQVNGVLK